MRLSQPTETVRVPVSSRPIVCGVVGGSQRRATSSSVIPRARRTSLIRVIIASIPKHAEPIWFFYCPTDLPMWQVIANSTAGGGCMTNAGAARLLGERAIDREATPD